MNMLAKVFRVPSVKQLSVAVTPTKNIVGKRDFTRTIWYMCRSENINGTSSVFPKELLKPTISCSCGCAGSKHIHTKGERELVEFLTEEIVAEKKAQKKKTLPTDIDGFKVKLNGADVELTKQSDKEKIVVSFNVNHTVDAEDEAEIDPNADKPEFAEMRSKPQFEIDIVRGSQTLSFTCSFLQGEAQEGEYNDVFGIDEITLFEGEWNDKCYAVAGDVLDGYLYDLLMNFLEEKGVSNEFAEKLSDFSTAYEHTAYISLLEGISKFTIEKK
ncbi:complement component 1 Q subcomponent-binding protein, mitochondrial [Aedes albopictus]|uniref:Complement component 1 n=1 Tax=Aedes albopictus TaxID=7160 RepID=A0ABM1Y9C8_AEDAL|nr:complement component 1 Q subcomponent-binding protein, mitochondrial-like [Aedes albopictus]XP_029728223.1 complement component 1 Q subcomponent-binding protein, mitochondrial-like [Aedes albopictus]